MEKKTLYALSALAVLSVLAVLALRAPEKDERIGERPRPVAKIPSGSIAKRWASCSASTQAPSSAARSTHRATRRFRS